MKVAELKEIFNYEPDDAEVLAVSIVIRNNNMLGETTAYEMGTEEQLRVRVIN